MLSSLIGETKETCAFDIGQLNARSSLPRWPSFEFGLVRRGVVIRQRVTPNGDASGIDAVGPGGIFPIEEGGAVGYCATDSLICLAPRGVMAAAIRGGDGEDLLRLHRAALARVERLAQARGAPTVGKKVAHLLITLAETLSPPRVRDDLPEGLQQRDLATLIGVRHETLCRSVGKLEKDGALRRACGGVIEHLDLGALREVV